MMHLRRGLPIAWAVISIFLFSSSAFGQGKSPEAKAGHFGIGQPKSIQDLPYSKFRKELEQLPPKAKGKALGWLQSFEFPVEDLASLRVSKFGEIAYADHNVPSNTEETSNIIESLMNSNIDESKAFSLHSRPGSSNVLYLDFDGHVLEGTAWSSSTLVALPFDPSQNDSPATEANFTQDELNRIHEIWHRIAEDFAAFDVDVTTEDPVVFTPTTGRLLFTHDLDATGKPMPSQGAGGVAYINVFGRTDYASKYSPALVYYTNLSSSSYGVPAHNAEAGSHEFGHNLGLGHDGISGGGTYYDGHGSGLVSWAPIMGRPYYKNITQWSKGEYDGANNTQDDIQILAGRLGYVSDDHSDSTSTATSLVVESNGDILVSSPEIDPDNVLGQNKGIIDDRNDVDLFYIDLDTSGTIDLQATPAWHSFYLDDGRGANLDIELTIFDSEMNLIAFDEPDDNSNAGISVPVTAGRYYVQVDGIDNTTSSDYSDYGSLGMYFLEGHVSAGVIQAEPDTTPPTPSVMGWSVPPEALSGSSVTMTATTATDESGSVEYLFSCVAGGAGCTDSDWQANPSFTLNGLASDTYYAFKVIARDRYGNETEPSSTMGDTTFAAKPVVENQVPTAVITYNQQLVVIERGNSTEITLDGSGSNDPDGEIVAWEWIDSDGNVAGNSPTLALSLREGTFTYSLTVTDNQGATGFESVSLDVTKSRTTGKPTSKKG